MLHLSRHDTDTLRALTSSNSGASVAVLFACNQSFHGRLSTHPRYRGATNLSERSQQEEMHENKRRNFRKLLGCRRVDGVASNGQASKEIFDGEVKTDGSANDTDDAP